MNAKLQRRFADLSLSEKKLLLTRMIHALTISARAHYAEPVEIRSEKLETINEVIHIASAKLQSLTSADAQDYPDDVFLSVLYEKAGLLGRPDLTWALDSALSKAKE